MTDPPVVLVHGFATSARADLGRQRLDRPAAATPAARSSPSTSSATATADKPHDPAAYAELESLVAGAAARRTGRRHRVLDGRSRAAHPRRRPTRPLRPARRRRRRRQPVPRRSARRHRARRSAARRPTTIRPRSTSPGSPRQPGNDRRSARRAACSRRARRSTTGAWPRSRVRCSSCWATRTSPARPIRSSRRCRTPSS